MNKNKPLAELLNLNIEVKGRNKMEVQKVMVLPNNFIHNEELCKQIGHPNMYQEYIEPKWKTAKHDYHSYAVYAWAKKQGETFFTLRAIYPTAKDCEILAPIMRKVQYINGIIESQRSFAINKYVDYFLKETSIFIDKLVEDVNKDCSNPWENFNKAKEEEKLKRKAKREKEKNEAK